MADEALRQLGHIDLLVNNAGVAWQGLLTDMTDDDWHTVLDTSLTAAFYTCRAVLPGMVSRKSGRIVNISSIWGRVGASCEAAYSAAKAGLIGLTKALAKEVGLSGITVNCLCPGVIRTDMLACYTEDDLAALADETPLGRLGTPKAVAAAVCWLADDSASFITGQVIGVDGGFGQ
jgi:3-oxoacyl-[acyl-carrier protein] reductase